MTQLLGHGISATTRWIERRTAGRRAQWFKELEARRGKNRAIVALANKNARRIWVLMAKGQEYDMAA